MEYSHFKYADDLLHAIEELIRHKVTQFAVAKGEQGWSISHPPLEQPLHEYVRGQ